MTSDIDNSNYSKIRNDIENVFKSIRTLFFEKLENPDNYWINVDLEFTKKDPDEDCDFPQARTNFNKLILEKDNRRKRYKKESRKKNKELKNVGKKRPRKSAEKNVTIDDFESSRENKNKENNLSDSSESLVSTKCKRSQKDRSIDKRAKKTCRKKNRKKEKPFEKSKKEKFCRYKKKNYFPIPDDDISSDENTSKIKRKGKRSKNTTKNKIIKNDAAETTLETDINIKHIKVKKILPQNEISISKIDPKLLLPNNAVLCFYRNETLKFLREACCNSRIILFKQRK